ncbi:MAG: uracil-DNA glycosylase [Chloroflexi bacterium]|nr:MAG: uracil-DNA glycosylase [Chloroflexota bacterium]
MPTKVCKWYNVCPIKRFYEQGKLEKKWVERYCWDDNERCVRYQLEETDEPHSDNLLPNGEIRKGLN